MVITDSKYENNINNVQKQVSRRTTGQQALAMIEIIGEIIWIWLKILLAIAETIYRTFIPAREVSVKNEIVLVTGAGHGIGKQLAIKYASEGAKVICWDVDSTSNTETVKEIEYLGYQKAHGYQCDITNREAVFQTAKKVQGEVGDVSILVNNAGIMPTHPLLDHSVEEIEKIISVNFTSHFWTLKAFLPSMIKNQHGHIICLSSCAGLFGFSNIVPYCASKFGVRGLMDSLSEELRQIYPNCNVKTTTVYPYMVNTGLCKTPRIRFNDYMPMLDPKIVASDIVSAQRRGVPEITTPGYFYNSFRILTLLPRKAIIYLNDFVGAGLESDLN